MCANDINNMEEFSEKYGVAPLKLFGNKSRKKNSPLCYRPELDAFPLSGDEIHLIYL